VRSEHEATFTAYVSSRSSALLRFASLLTGDVGEAEELLQVALIRLASHWPLRSDDPTTYVKRTLTNLSYDRGRSLRRHRQLAIRATEPVRVDFTEVHAESDAVLRALATLPRRQRLMVVLRYVEGMSEREAASAAGCSVGTVKSQASRGLDRLRLVLVDELRTR
jgi:RNA polymerase sigma-70 factor (sigma-E family)